MNVNSLFSITDAYVQSILSNTVNQAAGKTSTADPSSLTLPQDSSPQLSPFARILGTLQTLQQSDPAKYQQVTSRIAANLQSAAQTAQANGNSSQASDLSQLATDFTNASQNNTLPNVQDLAQALAGAHGHHHHRAHPASSNSDSTASTNAASTSAPSSSSSTTDLSQWISQFLVNSTSSAQNESLDPFSIISDTLSQAGL